MPACAERVFVNCLGNSYGAEGQNRTGDTSFFRPIVFTDYEVGSVTFFREAHLILYA